MLQWVTNALHSSSQYFMAFFEKLFQREEVIEQPHYWNLRPHLPAPCTACSLGSITMIGSILKEPLMSTI